MRILQLIAATIISIAASSAAQDQLRLTGDDAPLSVSIGKESREQIDFTEEDSTVLQGIKVDKLEWFYYADAPQAFKNGMDAFDSGRYARALQEFLDAQKSGAPTRNNWMQVQLDYYLPVCAFLAASDEKETAKGAAIAAEGLARFAQVHPQSWLSSSARYFQGRALISLGRFVEADKLFQELRNSSSIPGIQARADYGLLLSCKAQGKDEEVAKMAFAAISARRTNPEILEILAETLLDRKKDFPTALKISEELLRSGDRAQLQKAFEISGCARFHLGNHAQALKDLLMADLLYSSRASPASRRTRLHLALSIKVLMAKDPKQYPAWEYDRLLGEHMQKLPEEDRRFVKDFK